MKYVLLLCACMVCGCSVIEFSSKAPAVGRVIENSIDDAEIIIRSVEDASGATLSPELVESSSYYASKVQTGAAIAQGVASAVAAIPGPQQPIAGLLVGLIGVVGGIAGGVGRFMARRRERIAQDAVKVMVKATEPLPGSGAAVADALPKGEVGKLIEAKYQEVVS